jgi:hypothetical protein
MDVGRQPRKLNKDKDMKLATWNVRSLYRPGALAKLNDELNKYGIAITAVLASKNVNKKYLVL